MSDAAEFEDQINLLSEIERVLYRKSTPAERLAVIRSMVNKNDDAETLRRIAGDKELLYNVGRLAVEDVLIDFRDSGIYLLGRNNGLVVKHKDGTPSDGIRLTIEDALRLGMQAMADHLEKENEDG